MEILPLATEALWREAHPVMQDLRPDLSEDAFVRSLYTIIPAGYRLFAVRVRSKIACIAGFQIHTNIPYGRHIWVYDLVTATRFRSHGYGKVMLDFIEAFAKQNACSTVCLQTSLLREGAQRFYEKRKGFEKFGYVYRKSVAVLEDAELTGAALALP